MTPLLGKPLTEYIFIDDARRRGGRRGSSSSCCRPRSPSPRCWPPTSRLTRLLAAYGITPDIVMGHSLGEYGALVAAGRTVRSRPPSRR